MLQQENERLTLLFQGEKATRLCILQSTYGISKRRLLHDLKQAELRSRLAVFHFGGHADSLHIHLEGPEGQADPIQFSDLLPLLQACPRLQLVFLNGCFSADQAGELLDGGIPIVIGTTGAIDDKVAQSFAEAFYHQLIEGESVEKSFQLARSLVKVEFKEYTPETTRGIGRAPNFGMASFVIEYRDGSRRSGRWNLPDAADDPLYALPPIPEAGYDYPDHPYEYLKYYTKKDARIFFGRGHLINELYQLVSDETHRLGSVITVSGQSGVGKSSLLAAGLLPRLESGYRTEYYRWESDRGFPEQLKALLPVAQAEWKTAWIALEEQEQRPLLVVLDQVDGLLNSNDPEHVAEWEQTLQILAHLFKDRRDLPRGKVLLAYRTEYDQRIVDALTTHGLSRAECLVKKLDEKSIREVVRGLDKDQGGLIASKYQLSVEEGLASDISAFLLLDSSSPVAPILNILLTKMWEDQRGATGKEFTRARFRAVTESGVLLSDFYEQQMAILREKEVHYPVDVVQSGLALDVLEFHTTERGAARTRQLEAIRQQYRHQIEVMDQLLADLKATYLLTEIGAGTSLTHDTLGPIIQESVNNSSLPGQRAYRILRTKLPEYRKAKQATFVEGADLEIVLNGQPGMRAWEPEEEQLIAQSIELRDRRLRRARRIRLALTSLVVLIALTGAVAAWFGIQATRRGARIAQDKAFAEAQLLAETDPTLALYYMRAAYGDQPLAPERRGRWYEVYAASTVYDLPPDVQWAGSDLNLAAFSPDNRHFAIASSDTTAIQWYEYGNSEPVDWLDAPRSITTWLQFDDAGCLLIANQNRHAYRWCQSEGLLVDFAPGAGRDTSAPRQLVGPVAGRFATRHQGGTLALWDGSSGAHLRSVDAAYGVRAIAAGGTSFWAAIDRGALLEIDEDGNVVQQIPLPEAGEVRSMTFTDSATVLVVGLENGNILRWERLDSGWQPLPSLNSVNGAVTSFQFGPGNRWLAATYRNGKPILWNMDTARPLHTLLDSFGVVSNLGYRKADRKLMTAGRDGHIRAWTISYPHPVWADSISNYSIRKLVFRDSQLITAVDQSGSIWRFNVTSKQLAVRRQGNTLLEGKPAIGAAGNRVWMEDRKGNYLIDLKSIPADVRKLPVSSVQDIELLENDEIILNREGISILGNPSVKFYHINPETLTQIALDEDQQTIAAISPNGQINFWDASTGRLLQEIETNGDLNDLFFTKDDTWWSPQDNGQLLVIRGNAVVDTLTGGQTVRRSERGGKYLALDFDRRTIRVYTYGGYLLETLTSPADEELEDVAIDPSGTWVAAGTSSGKLLVWRLEKPVIE